jgi:hypothetical protein
VVRSTGVVTRFLNVLALPVDLTTGPVDGALGVAGLAGGPSDAKKTGDKAYIYANSAAMESDISITDNSTILASLSMAAELA